MTPPNPPPSHGQVLAVEWIFAGVVLYAAVFIALTVRAHRLDRRDQTISEPGAATALTHPGTGPAGTASPMPAGLPATPPEVSAT